MSHLFRKYIAQKVLPIMKNIENIRNVTIIAHIDHGKTTLSDSLLAASGLISKKLASELRYLDYDQIEQTRGITIKAANAVIHYTYKGQEYIINLIDTPGHIDFSGYVTRSLRASDGALVVIDAIEGVMVQTETVTRQALSEYVKPVLFINKVDRLIKEKRLNPDDFLKAINDIVRNFNILLEKYSESKISENWRVSFLRLNVAFGSAKDKWGVRLIDILEWAGKSINDVKSTSELLQILKDFLKYVYSKYRENNVKELSERFPVEKAVLEMMIDHIPNPREAQKARVPIIWQGDLSSEIGKALIECDLNAPPVVFIYDVKYDLKAGFIATGRVFSGTIKVKQALHMVHAGNDFIVNQLAVVIGKSKIPVREVSSGNHVVFIGVKDIIVGETIVSPELKNIEPFERLRYVSEPVVTVSIEPVDFSQYDYVQQMISQFAKTEPGIEFSINKDTGEMLLSGMGELQIEIFLQKLQRVGIYVEVGRPIVLYREGILRPSRFLSKETKEGTKFTYRVLPLNECFIQKIESQRVGEIGKILSECGILGRGTIVGYNPKYKNTVIDSSGTIPEALYPQIKTTIDLILQRGPLVGEPCYGILIEISEFGSLLPTDKIDLIELNEAFNEIKTLILESEPTLLEPWQKFEITTPSEYVGDIVAVLNKRLAKILTIDSFKYLYKVIAEMPVRFSFGISNELRDVSKGYATWGAEHLGYRPVKENMEQLIFDIKRQKGLL